MARISTPTFIHTLALITSASDDRVLDSRLHAATQIYNATLGEGLKRLALLRERKEWKATLSLPKGSKGRNDVLNGLRTEFGLTDYGMQDIARRHWRQGCFDDRLDTQSVQKTGSRVWNSIKDYMFGLRGRPRFKAYQRTRSIEGKSNASGITWRDGKVKWKGLLLSAIFDKKDKHGVEAHALASRVKYLRLIKRLVKGKNRWYAQLILEGTPLQKAHHRLGHGNITGIDIGPSTIAAVSKNEAWLKGFCSELAFKSDEIKAIQRKMDSSLREMNPSNYRANGTIRPGVKIWHKSARYRAMENKAAELQRVMAATRKCLHAQMANNILAMGTTVMAEKLSYRSFQKLFGKSVGARAPGMFMQLLRRKAENAGGKVIEFSTYHTRLSQTCVCGQVKKKTMGERWHSCSCGVQGQRDLVSAYLACHVNDNTLSISQSQQGWAGAESLLEQAMERLMHQVANGGAKAPSSFGLDVFRRQSRSSVNLSQSTAQGSGCCRKAAIKFVDREPGRECSNAKSVLSS